MAKKKIYVWINNSSPEFVLPIAMCEDGHVLAEHACSHKWSVKEDMGLTSNRKHIYYDLHCGEDNWKLEYIEEDNVNIHEGLIEAYRLNQLLGKEAKK
jgi:hypothetical protein